jgi:hypothetical protein
MPYALERGDVAGAVVSVVKNGEVIFAKGYRYADVEKHKPVDAERTMFRPGSISKLFTWTAQASSISTTTSMNTWTSRSRRARTVRSRCATS